MLGLNYNRINQLEAANRRLSAERLAQEQRIDALSRIIVTLQRENEALTRQCANMATTTQHATQQAQAGRGYVCGESALERVSVN